MMVYIVCSLNFCSVEYYYACATYALRICYDFSTQKLHYTTATLRYLFLIRTIASNYTIKSLVL